MKYKNCEEWWYNPNFQIKNYIIWYDNDCSEVLELEDNNIICSKQMKHGFLHKISTDSLSEVNTIFYAKCSFNSSATYTRQLNKYKYRNFAVKVWMIEKSTNTVQGFTNFGAPIFPKKGEPDVSNIEQIDSWADYLKYKNKE
ncbi:MAG: hypothetical protein IPJ40_11140 [Saprospirales bacterium]|nr:hypothetical protein [Saprospirales bacterium]